MKRVFDAFNKCAIKYCVLRNFKGLPETNSSNDIDIMIDISQQKEVIRIFADLKYIRQDYGKPPQYFALNYDPFSGRWIKFHIQPVLYAHVFRLPIEESVLKRRLKYKNFFIPSKEDRFILLLFQSIFNKGRFKEVYQYELQELLDSDINIKYISECITSLVGLSLAECIMELTSAGDYQALIYLKAELIRSMLKSNFWMNVCSVLRISWNKLAMMGIFALFFHSKGMSIALIGPDGSGKTTIAKRLLELPLKSKYIYMGSDNYILPIHRILKKTMRAKKRIPENQEKNPVKTYLVYGHRFFEMYLRYLFRALVYYRRGYLIIYDRYLYDIFTGKDHSKRIKFNRFIYRLFPKPDITFYLKIDPKTAFNRKQEHSEEIIKDLCSEYKQLGGFIGNWVVIDAGQKIDTVVDYIIDYVLGRYRMERNFKCIAR